MPEHVIVRYHDSCYLGRYNDVYDAPRGTLRRALPVVDLVEAPRTPEPRAVLRRRRRPHVDGGAPGKRINIERTEELLATGADRDRGGLPVLHDDDQ